MNMQQEDKVINYAITYSKNIMKNTSRSDQTGFIVSNSL